MASTIAPLELRDGTAGFEDAQWVDVRSPSEFAACHLPGTINIPLEELDSRLDDLSQERPIVLICQGGQRAKIAAERLGPHRARRIVLEGGTKAWVDSGLPWVSSVRSRWSLERQVRLGAGIITLAGVILSILVKPIWILLPAFAGAGLVFAGLTDICPMGLVLARLPWNRRPGGKAEVIGNRCSM